MSVTEFMLQLSKNIIDTRKVGESTAAAYIRSLYILNDKKPFKTLTFLKDTEKIDKLIVAYAPSTQKALYSTLSSVLSLYKDKPTYKRVYTFYYDKMMGKSKEASEVNPHEKTATQKDNWISWDEVKKRHSDLKEKVDAFVSQKALTPSQFETLLQYTVLSLYTFSQPRRNQDYMDMFVSILKKLKPEELSKDKNYLTVEKIPTKFIFNKYKTAKKYGQQIIDISPELSEVLAMYLKHHPLLKGNKSKTVECKFLVNSDGTPFTALNAITRILNKIFGKKIGSSMLRHIYISDKFGDEFKEMSETAANMGHSVSEQRNYAKSDNLT